MADEISQPRETVPASSTMRCSSAVLYSSDPSWWVLRDGGVHDAELGAPLVECGAANSVFTVQSRYACGRFGLLEDGQNLAIPESGYRRLHAEHPRAHGENPTPDGCGFQGRGIAPSAISTCLIICYD